MELQPALPHVAQQEATSLFQSALDALPVSIAVLETDGTMVAANAAWHRFTETWSPLVPGQGIGTNYLDACRAATSPWEDTGRTIARGVREVIGLERDTFTHEYPLTDPRGEFWFVVRVSRASTGQPARVVVTHEDITERRRAAQALQSSERRFRSLIENAADILTILNAGGTIQYESPSVERSLGYAAQARVGRSLFEFIDPDDLPQLVDTFTECLRRPDENIPVNFRFLDAAGACRIVEGTLKNLLEDPAVAGVVMSSREITEQERAEEARARLTAVLNATPDFVGMTDAHGRLSYLNRAARRMMEIDDEEDVSGINLPDLHPHWANELIIDEGMPTAIREGVWTGETALLGPHGKEIPVLQAILAHRTPSGAVEFFSTTARDITERKRGEEALRESNELFRQLAENITEMFWIFDLRVGRPVYVSPAFEKIWGRPVRSVYDDPASFLEFVAPADRHEVTRSAVQPGQEDGEDLQYRIVRPDGSSRWLRARSFPIRDGDGSTYRIAGLTEDVTERKQLEDELRNAQKLESIGQLAAGIAHEINTPIQYVGDNIRFLKDAFGDLAELLGKHGELLSAAREGAVAPDLLEEVDALALDLDLEYLLGEVPRAAFQSLEGVDRVAEIVRAMKDFSHPGTREKIPVDLNQALQSTLTVARNEWKYLAEVVTGFDPGLPPVPCLPGDVNQVFLNLVVNAAHAIADVVGDGSEEKGTITVSTHHDGGWAEVRIRDTGAGIPEAIRSRIFDPFFTTKQVGRGTGQGLTISHNVVVEKHGGTLTFESETGRGTTFIVRLPLSSTPPDQPEKHHR